MLKLEQIEKRYGTIRAADGVSLTLYDGESLVLAGESGSGKTTLAKIIAGMCRPDSGRVLLDGRELGAVSGRRSFEDCAGIQYIFQDPYSALESGFTVRKTLEETARICRRNKRPCIPAEEAMTYVDRKLVGKLDRPVGELSGGQRQKVCIARALMPEPRLIIADESTSMLDKDSGIEVFDLLNRIKTEKGISILAILHDVDFSYTGWDRIAVMWQGKLVEQAIFAEFPATAVHSYSRCLLEAYQYFNGRDVHERTGKASFGNGEGGIQKTGAGAGFRAE